MRLGGRSDLGDDPKESIHSVQKEVRREWLEIPYEDTMSRNSSSPKEDLLSTAELFRNSKYLLYSASYRESGGGGGRGRRSRDLDGHRKETEEH
jgi:hypothetical protein